MKDIEDDEPDVILRLRDIDFDSEASHEPIEHIVEFGRIVSDNVETYKLSISRFFELQKKVQLIKKQNDELIHILQRINGLPGFEKMEEGVNEYIESMDLDNLKKELADTKNTVAQYLSCFKTLKEVERFLCFVCLEATCDSYLDPCGHVVCGPCSMKLIGKCPFCRCHVSPKKIHWSC